MKKAILDNIDEDVDDFFPGGSSIWKLAVK